MILLPRRLIMLMLARQPHSYPLSAVTADIDGAAITGIGYSSYVSGIELALGNKAIRPGGTGIVHVRIPNISNALYLSDVEDYASFNFSPNLLWQRICQGQPQI